MTLAANFLYFLYFQPCSELILSYCFHQCFTKLIMNVLWNMLIYIIPILSWGILLPYKRLAQVGFEPVNLVLTVHSLQPLSCVAEQWDAVNGLQDQVVTRQSHHLFDCSRWIKITLKTIYILVFLVAVGCAWAISLGPDLFFCSFDISIIFFPYQLLIFFWKVKSHSILLKVIPFFQLRIY